MVAPTYVPSVQANSFTIQVARIEDLVQEILQLNLAGLGSNKETLPKVINTISASAQWLLQIIQNVRSGPLTMAGWRLLRQTQEPRSEPARPSAPEAPSSFSGCLHALP